MPTSNSAALKQLKALKAKQQQPTEYMEPSQQVSQTQLNTLSVMVETLLQEQTNLKHKISEQEKILETHLGSAKPGERGESIGVLGGEGKSSSR
jgi:hypothetical protein